MSESRATPIQITDQLSNWIHCFWFWNIAHYVLGLFATVGAIAVAQKLDFINPVAVAVATAMITFLKASGKANAYIAAWRYLNAERICFELDPQYTESKLAEAHKKCEAIIGKAD